MLILASASMQYLKRYGITLLHEFGVEIDDSVVSDDPHVFMIDTEKRMAILHSIPFLLGDTGFYKTKDGKEFLNLYRLGNYRYSNNIQWITPGTAEAELNTYNLLHFMLSVGRGPKLVYGELAADTMHATITKSETIVVCGVAGSGNGVNHIRLYEENIYNLWRIGSISYYDILNIHNGGTKVASSPTCPHCGKKITKRNANIIIGHVCNQCVRKLYTEVDGVLYEKKNLYHCIKSNTYHRHRPPGYIVICDENSDNGLEIAPIEWADQNCHYIGGNYYYKNLPEIDRFGYHEVRRTIKGSQDKPLIGFEVEKSRGNNESLASEILLKNGWIKERDGSLPDNGFELVSPAFNIDHNFKKEFESIKDLLNLPVSSSCGGHINLSLPNISPRKTFEQISGFVPLLLSMYSGRLCNEYCRENLDKRDDKDEHYSAISLHENRVEFRLISAVKNVEQLLWRTKLFALIVKYKTESVSDVVKMCCDSHHEIHKHLRKIYSHDTLKQRLLQAKEYAFNYSYAKHDEVIDVRVEKTRITNKNIEP